MNNTKPTWKNTLNYDNGIWIALSDFIAAAASIGYPYALWHDNRVYGHSLDKYGSIVTEPTEYTLQDLETDA